MVFGSGNSHHGFLVNDDSKLFGWGLNRNYQLGLGDNVTRTKLSEITFFSSKRIRKISCGVFHSIFITENNELYSTGDNEDGQLGIVQIENELKVPTQVTIKHQNEVVKVIDTFVGAEYSIVLSNLLEAYSFGYNSKGQLGVGDTIRKFTGTRIILSEKILSICCGVYYSCFISVNGGVFVCGEVNKEIVMTPKKILFLEKIIQVACGENFTLFVSEDNKVYGTGFNEDGALGIGNIVSKTTLCLVASLKDEKVILVKCGGGHSFFKCKDKIMMCGNNYFGQTGIGNGKYEKVFTPILLKRKETFIQSLMLSCSSIHFTKNEVYGCGENDWGQLFCGKKKEKNKKIFKIRNLKVKKRNFVKKKEDLERFEFLKLNIKDDTTNFLIF